MRQLSSGAGHGQHKTELGRGEPGRLCPMVAWAPSLVKISYRGTENRSPRERGIPLSEVVKAEFVEADALRVHRAGTGEDGPCTGEPGSPRVGSL